MVCEETLGWSKVKGLRKALQVRQLTGDGREGEQSVGALESWVELRTVQEWEQTVVAERGERERICEECFLSGDDVLHVLTSIIKRVIGVIGGSCIGEGNTEGIPL